MSSAKREQLIDEAEGFREKGEAKAAIDVLHEYAEQNLDDTEVGLLLARLYDSIGRERDAIPYYQRVLEADPSDAVLVDAGIGLGSSLRSLGEFEQAITVLERVVERRPDNRAAETFLAMARFNAGQQQEAFETVLRILADSSSDQDIRAYNGALKFYAEDIAATWTD